jgi:hypothetical protein
MWHYVGTITPSVLNDLNVCVSDWFCVDWRLTSSASSLSALIWLDKPWDVHAISHGQYQRSG